MKICITRSERYAYSETFIRDQLAGFSKLAQVYPIHTGRLPERSEDGKLLSPPLFWMLHKFSKAITGQRNNYFSHYGLKKFLLGQKIEVVLANYGLTAAHLVPVCRELNIPMVVIFHGHDASDNTIIKTYRKRYRDLFAYTSSIIAVSGEMKRRLVSLGAPAEKVSVVPCGVNTAAFTPSARKKEKMFLSVGRFVNKKGPLHTIRAFHEVWKKHPEAKLVMAGAHTGMFKACEKLVSSLDMENSISFPCIVQHAQVNALMQQAFAFVQHSVTAANGDQEGTPVSILEAAAAGLPVISTFHGGISEAVVHEKTGLLVKEGDVQGMANNMVKLLEDHSLANEMRIAAREHVITHYNQQAQIQKLYDHAAAALSKIPV